MRVLALTFGGPDYASSFYRIYQYQEPLREIGIDLEICPIKTVDWKREFAGYDLLLLQKKLVPRHHLQRLTTASSPLVYDVDDAIWHRQEGKHSWWTTWRIQMRLRRIVRCARLCLAANTVLSDYLRRFGANVQVFPMTLDERAWHPRPEPSRVGVVRVGWTGKPQNLGYLESIEQPLADVQQQFPEVEFVVFSGQKPRLNRLRVEFIPYQPGIEPSVVQTFDIGLLPLPSGKFAEGKSPIKALQYMASAVPSVISARGATRDLYGDGDAACFAETEAEWNSALSLLISNAQLREGMGRNGRKRFEERYGMRAAVPELAGILSRLAARREEPSDSVMG